jgi:hypothetical protein
MAKVFTSAIIDAPIEKVWTMVRDFNGMPAWHPGIRDSVIEGGLRSDVIGCVRKFQVEGLGQIREQLLDLSDIEHCFTYSILEAPTPWTNYVATLQLRRVTAGDKTFAQWTAEFGCPPDQEAHFVDMVGQGVFQTAFDTLNKRLAGGR